MQALGKGNCVCWTKFVSVPIQIKQKEKQTNKQAWKTIAQAWIYRWIADIAWYFMMAQAGKLYWICRHCIKFIARCVRTFDIFFLFSSLEKQIACRMLYYNKFLAAETITLPQFKKTLNMQTICCTQECDSSRIYFCLLLHHYLWCNFLFICISHGILCAVRRTNCWPC